MVRKPFKIEALQNDLKLKRFKLKLFEVKVLQLVNGLEIKNNEN